MCCEMESVEVPVLVQNKSVLWTELRVLYPCRVQCGSEIRNWV
jgi:hypothetical protein